MAMPLVGRVDAHTLAEMREAIERVLALTGEPGAGTECRVEDRPAFDPGEWEVTLTLRVRLPWRG